MCACVCARVPVRACACVRACTCLVCCKALWQIRGTFVSISSPSQYFCRLLIPGIFCNNTERDVLKREVDDLSRQVQVLLKETLPRDSPLLSTLNEASSNMAVEPEPLVPISMITFSNVQVRETC